MRQSSVAALVVAAVALAASARAPSGLTPDGQRVLSRLDADRVARLTRTFSEDIVENHSGAGAGSIISGSDDEARMAEEIARRLGELGPDLRVHLESFPVRAFDYGAVGLSIDGIGVDAITLHSGGGTHGVRDGVSYRRGSASDGRRLEVPIVDAGDGLRADYQRLPSVRGKAVLVRWTFWPGFLIREAATQGAAAIVLYDYPGRSQPDALRQNTVIGRDSIPSVHISTRHAEEIRAKLSKGELPMTLENEVSSRIGRSENVVAVVAGSEAADEWILVGAHHDRWFRGAQDNAVGTAMMLELARAMVTRGRHRRSVAFVSFGSEETGGLDAEYDWLTGSYAFLRAHPEIARRLVYGFNIDGAGWSAEKGYLYASLELQPFQRTLLEDLGLADRIELREGVTDVVDAWTLGAVGGASLAYLLWFESHAIDSGDESSYSQYYHTQLDLFRPQWYRNLGIDLRVGALALVRMDRVGALPHRLSAVGDWQAAELSRLKREAHPLAAAAFEEAIQAAAAFTETAQAFETASAGPAEHNRRLLLARSLLVPWIFSLSSRGAVARPEPYVEDWLALGEAGRALEEGRLGASAQALEKIGTMGWGASLSNDSYLAERLAAFSAPDWSNDYDQNPRPVSPEVHAIYLGLLRGDAGDGSRERLASMAVAVEANLGEVLFVLAGKLTRAAQLLRFDEGSLAPDLGPGRALRVER